MTSRERTELTDRQARVAEIKRTQKRSERKRTVLVAAVAGVLVLGLTGATIAVMVNASQQTASINAAARSPIEGVKTFPPCTRQTPRSGRCAGVS